LDHRSTIFVEAMIVIAVIGVLAFLIGLLARAPQRQQAGAKGTGQPPQPRWYEFTLAVILLAAIAAFAIWIISTGKQWVWGESIENWRSDPRAIVFAAVMVALGVIGLAVSLAYAAVQSAQSPAPRRPMEISEAAAAPTGAAVTSTPSPLRLLGLFVLALAILLLCWIALPSAAQYRLIVQLIFPASLGVALVLVFDKATRAWGTKRGAETLREWLFCDLLIFLLVLAFLNLHHVAKPEAYAGSFWDILNLVLLFAAFWMVDRSASRGRFLFGYGYLIVVPLLLLIWDAVQGVAAAASWWASVWPFLILAVVFFVLEAVTLISSGGERQTLPAVKDGLFVILYAVLLIVAVKSA